MRKIFLAGLIIIALAITGCNPLNDGEEQNNKPQGEVQTEPSDQGESDPDLVELNDQDEALAENFVCEVFPLLNNEVLVKLTNYNEEDIQKLTMNIEFYDEQKNIITYYETYFMGIKANQVLYEFSTHLKNYETKWDTYSITYEAKYDSPDGLHNYYSALENVEIDEKIRAEGNYSFNVNIRNSGPETIDYVNAFMLFYHEDELTGVTQRFAQDIASGDNAELSFMPSTDSESRMIPFDRYEVFISEACYKESF